MQTTVDKERLTLGNMYVCINSELTLTKILDGSSKLILVVTSPALPGVARCGGVMRASGGPPTKSFRNR